MIDPQVQHLLKEAVDSPIKLHLLLTFHEHHGMQVTAEQMAGHVCRDIWSVSQALHELARDGILEVGRAVSEPVFYYQPRSRYIKPILSLVSEYNDPLERITLHRRVRELAEYASIKHQPNIETVG
jgi:hypothetical protein